MNDLSIIIVNWNSTEYLRHCLATVFLETRGIAFEVIVVDNASRDMSCSELIHSEFPEVILYRSADNIGFAAASNLGYRLSSGECLLFLNPDTELKSNVLPVMIAELKSNDRIGAVGVRLLNTDGSVQMSCIQAYPTMVNQILDSQVLRDRMPQSRLWGMKPLFVRMGEPAEVDVISGACLMVRRDVFVEVGEFDERYFMYVEDVDLCYRITSANYKIHYLDDCEVIHHGGKSSALQGKCFVNLRQQEAVVKFFSLTKGRWYSVIYRVALASAAAVRLAIIGCILPFQRSKERTMATSASLNKWVSLFRWAIAREA
jgi:N-acetylglucosaminyl-diphospho-decaprenol L-rhamnosyltransferase